LLSMPSSISVRLLGTRNMVGNLAERMCLSLVPVGIVHGAVGGRGMMGRLQSMSVLDGVASRDVVCGSAMVGGGGVVVSCEVAVVCSTLTVVRTASGIAGGEVVCRQRFMVFLSLPKRMGSAVMGMSGLVMCADKILSSMDIMKTLSTDIGIPVFTPRPTDGTSRSSDVVQTRYTVSV